VRARRFNAHSLRLSNANRARIDLLAELGITVPEWTLLNIVHYGMHCPPSDLPEHGTSVDYSLGQQNTLADCQAALDACLAKGWLQIINEVVLKGITDNIREERTLGPIYGLPPNGCVDFTRAGADVWRRFLDRARAGLKQPEFAYTDVVHTKVARLCPTLRAALAVAEEELNWAGIHTVSEPFLIGPWRLQWWRRFPAGYRVDVESRQSFQSRCSGGEGWSIDRSAWSLSNRSQLQHVLDRHNVTLSEWLLLAAMDDSLRTSHRAICRWILHWAKRRFEVAITEEHCRTGLDSCLRHGWLRIVDESHAAEAKSVLADDASIAPLAEVVQKGCGEIDFTPSGAALYRMIMAEYAGQNWENAIHAWQEYYREEHRYCQTQEGIQDTLQTYTGEDVRATRIVLIGPWCVYWWERFPSGYRLEVEIGAV
jgi:hypothetical protein